MQTTAHPRYLANMTVAEANSAIGPVVRAFIDSTTPRNIAAKYRLLVAALWSDGKPTSLALPAIPILIESLESAPVGRKPQFAILLGLLAEAEEPAGAIHATVRRGLDRYLDIFLGSIGDPALTFALLYLLGHFPDDRARIHNAATSLSLDPDDLTRLDRSLRALDLHDPGLGRVWPSPSAWSRSDAEREVDLRWMRALPTERVAQLWDNDTRALLCYSGAKALWAAERGWTPPGDDPDLMPPRADQPRRSVDVFGGHGEVFRCPACHGSLTIVPSGAPGGAHCRSCQREYPMVQGCLDLSEGAGERSDAKGGYVQYDTVLQLRYDMLRRAFLRLMGTNWAGAVPASCEDRYLIEHMKPTDGPVLDLAAGSGRWTALIARTFGWDRVIGLDLSAAMLSRLREAAPGIPTIRANALALPFADATLGAVNCWNALQTLPAPASVIDEVGRCLRPGGTFTLMTFRPSPDPVYRYFQSRPGGVVLFEPEELRGWLADAHMTMCDGSGEGSFLFVTAVRSTTTYFTPEARGDCG